MRVLIIALVLLSGPLRADTAVFAGGCFWCVEQAFQELEGVQSAVSGFTGGSLKNPTYSGNHRGHYEAVQVTFDPERISYAKLLQVFWANIDPFDDGGQFCDRGSSYLSALFVEEQQRDQALVSRTAIADRFPDQSVVTPILPAARFWPVEEYHQDYYLKNPVRYRYYKYACGRAQRLAEIESS